MRTFHFRPYNYCVIVIPTLLLLVPGHGSSTNFIHKIQSGIEDVTRGVDYLGKRISEFIGPGFSLSPREWPPFSAEKQVEERFSMGPAPILIVSNEFGEITITSWQDRLIEVKAIITVGADSPKMADDIVDLVNIQMSKGNEFLECKTYLPEIRNASNVSMTVNYQIQVPEDVSILIDNFFGDVRIHGVGGNIAATVQYGGLELNRIGGNVNTQVVGEFDVICRELKRGGTFTLQNVSAEFHNVQGDMSIQQFRGDLLVAYPAPQSKTIVTTDGGKVRFMLPSDTNPDFKATVIYGKLDSELDVSMNSFGRYLVARHPNAESDQKIAIDAAFSDITIEVEGRHPERTEATPGIVRAFTDVITEQFAPSDQENSLVLTAIPGNISIEGTDEETIALSASRIVWASSASVALDALEALHLQTSRDGQIIAVETSVSQELLPFGCETYRMDLHLKIPRLFHVTSYSKEGITTIEGLEVGGVVEQEKGEIVLENTNGDFVVTNLGGNVFARHCGGAITVNVRNGYASIEEVVGDINIQSYQGRIYIDDPGSAVSVHSLYGDIRLLSIDPVQGNFDVYVEKANINAFINHNSDAEIFLKTSGGRIQSALPLTGTISKDIQEFQGQLNRGTFKIRLQGENANIVLN